MIHTLYIVCIGSVYALFVQAESVLSRADRNIAVLVSQCTPAQDIGVAGIEVDLVSVDVVVQLFCA